MRGQAEECCFTTCLILPSWSPSGSCSASFFSHGWLIAQLPSPFSALVQSPCSASALSLSSPHPPVCLAPKKQQVHQGTEKAGLSGGQPVRAFQSLLHVIPPLCLQTSNLSPLPYPLPPSPRLSIPALLSLRCLPLLLQSPTSAALLFTGFTFFPGKL